MKKKCAMRLFLLAFGAIVLLMIATIPMRGFCIPWLCNGWDYCRLIFCPQYGQNCFGAYAIETNCMYGSYCHSVWIVQCEYGESTYWECDEPGCNGSK